MKTKTVTITPEVLDVLTRSTVTGNQLVLPPGQLDRKLYVAVNQVLELLGGKWNKKLKAHVFPSNPRTAIADAMGNGSVLDEQQTYQMFFTPAPLAAQMAAWADIRPGDRVLEPSAGAGAIVKAIHKDEPDVFIHAIEVNAKLHRELIDLAVAEGLAGNVITLADFTTVKPDGPDGIGYFDVVLMNPPFNNGQAIAHIEHALTFLSPAGVLVAICPNGPKERDRFMGRSTEWTELPAGTFAESGTNVSTALIAMNAAA
jgi:hypothetical protein